MTPTPLPPRPEWDYFGSYEICPKCKDFGCLHFEGGTPSDADGNEMDFKSTHYLTKLRCDNCGIFTVNEKNGEDTFWNHTVNTITEASAIKKEQAIVERLKIIWEEVTVGQTYANKSMLEDAKTHLKELIAEMERK